MKRLTLAAMVCLAMGAVFGDESPESEVVADPKLKDELVLRAVKDQQVRTDFMTFISDHGRNGLIELEKLNAAVRAQYDALAQKFSEVDAANTKWMKTVIDQHGWPTDSLVGKKGTQAAWLLVQHADADRAFQRRCLDLMEQLPAGAVRLQNLALLTDRVLLAEGKKQKYGSQFVIEDGKLVPRPIEDPDHVDERRLKMGLPTMAEYAEQMKKAYGFDTQE